eukprot:2761688-Pyramimonas_sp.AAC.1
MATPGGALAELEGLTHAAARALESRLGVRMECPRYLPEHGRSPQPEHLPLGVPAQQGELVQPTPNSMSSYVVPFARGRIYTPSTLTSRF